MFCAFMSLSLCGSLVIGTLTMASDKRKPKAAIGDPRDTAIWRSERVCGVNCLYLLLRFEGRDVDYLSLQNGLLNEKPTSLHELKAAAYRHDLDLRLARMKPSDLIGVHKPVVVHLESVDARAQTSGHFVLVTQAYKNGVQYIDGTTTELRSVAWKDFERSWDGFVAHSNEVGPVWWSGIDACAFGSGMVFACLACGLIQKRPIAMRRTPAIN